MLKGERIRLRPLQVEDIPRIHEHSQDPEIWVLNCDYPHVSPLESAHAFYESWTKFDDNMAPFAIEADGKYIGNCLLMNLKHRHRNAELGIVIGDRAYWGRGYGREAVKMLLAYGFRDIGLHRIEAFPHERNPRSIGCLKSCGFQEEGRARKVLWSAGEWLDVVQLSILEDEWKTLTH